jgi:hypothetical protein
MDDDHPGIEQCLQSLNDVILDSKIDGSFFDAALTIDTKYTIHASLMYMHPPFLSIGFCRPNDLYVETFTIIVHEVAILGKVKNTVCCTILDHIPLTLDCRAQVVGNFLLALQASSNEYSQSFGKPVCMMQSQEGYIILVFEGTHQDRKIPRLEVGSTSLRRAVRLCVDGWLDCIILSCVEKRFFWLANEDSLKWQQPLCISFQPYGASE